MAVVSEQAVAAAACSASAEAEHAAPSQARQRGHGEQGPQCATAVKLVIAERFGQRPDDRWLADHLA